MSIVIVSGTGTGVGKTVVSAALAALALDSGRSAAYVKVAQTGVRPGEAGDREAVCRLTGLDPVATHVGASFAAALSPEAAARAAGQPPVALPAVDTAVRRLAEGHDLVVVEGAGGLLVRLDAEGSTLADLARLLGAPVLVVAAAGLGTLNHTALTVEALVRRSLLLAGIVIGSWPIRPGPAELSNVADLQTIAGQPLAGALPGRAGRLGRARFREAARHGLAPAYGGKFDASRLGSPGVSPSRSGRPARA